MHRTTINIPERVFRNARLKALRDNVTVSEVLRELLKRWVAGEIQLVGEDDVRRRQVALARAAQGMWADRQPDELLAASRQGLRERDEGLARARLDA